MFELYLDDVQTYNMQNRSGSSPNFSLFKICQIIYGSPTTCGLCSVWDQSYEYKLIDWAV